MFNLAVGRCITFQGKIITIYGDDNSHTYLKTFFGYHTPSDQKYFFVNLQSRSDGKKEYNLSGFDATKILVINAVQSKEGIIFLPDNGKNHYIFDKDAKKFKIVKKNYYQIPRNLTNLECNPAPVHPGDSQLSRQKPLHPSNQQTTVENKKRKFIPLSSSSQIPPSNQITQATKRRKTSQQSGKQIISSRQAIFARIGNETNPNEANNGFKTNNGSLQSNSSTKILLIENSALLTQQEQRKRGIPLLKAYLENKHNEQATFSKAPPWPHQLTFLQDVFKIYQAYQNAKTQEIQALNQQSTALKFVYSCTTAGGKTNAFLLLSLIKKTKTMIVVPLNTLIQQTLERIKTDFPDAHIRIKVLKSEHKLLNEQRCKQIVSTADIIVTTIQTLQFHYKEVPWQSIEKVVIDEAHLALSQKRREMLSYISERGCAVQCYTATPGDSIEYNASNEKITNVFQALGFAPDGHNNPISPFTLKQGIEKKILAPVVCYLAKLTSTDKDFVLKCSRNKEYTQSEIERINTDRFNRMIADIFFNGKDHINHHSFRKKYCVVVAASIKHANALAALFNQIDPGIARAVHTGAEKDESSSGRKKKVQEIFDEYKKNTSRVKVLILVGIVTGIDIPKVNLIIFARPTRSKTFKLQAIGRGNRIDKNNPNKILHVVDFCWGNRGMSDIYYYFEALSQLEQGGSLISEYGNVDERRAKQIVEEVPSVVIDNVASYEIIHEPSKHSLVILAKTTGRQPRSTRIRSSAKQIQKNTPQFPIATGMERLCKVIESLDSLLQAIEDRAIIKLPAEPSAAQSNSTPTVSQRNTQPQPTSTRNTQRATQNNEEQNQGSVIMTRHMKNVIDNAKRRLTTVKALFAPNMAPRTYSSDPNTVGNQSPARPTRQSNILTVQQELQALTAQYQNLGNSINNLLKGSIIAIPDIEDEDIENKGKYITKEDADQAIKQINNLANMVKQIHTSVEKNQQNIIREVKNKRSSRQASDSANTSNQEVQNAFPVSQLVPVEINSPVEPIFANPTSSEQALKEKYTIAEFIAIKFLRNNRIFNLFDVIDHCFQVEPWSKNHYAIMAECTCVLLEERKNNLQAEINKIIEYAVERFLEAKYISKLGRTPVLRKYKHPISSSLLPDILKLILEYAKTVANIDLNSLSIQGLPLLHHVVCSNATPENIFNLMALLLEQGININATTRLNEPNASSHLYLTRSPRYNNLFFSALFLAVVTEKSTSYVRGSFNHRCFELGGQRDMKIINQTRWSVINFLIICGANDFNNIPYALYAEDIKTASKVNALILLRLNLVTLLNCLCILGADAAVYYLIEKNLIDVNNKDGSARTALYTLLSIKRTQVQENILKFLIKQGADVFCENFAKLTPIEIAVNYAHNFKLLTIDSSITLLKKLQFIQDEALWHRIIDSFVNMLIVSTLFSPVEISKSDFGNFMAAVENFFVKNKTSNNPTSDFLSKFFLKLADIRIDEKTPVNGLKNLLILFLEKNVI